MKVILKKDVEKLGKVNSIVNVKNGYAINMLIPQKKAILATKKNIQELKKNIERLTKKIEKERLEAQNTKKLIENIVLNFTLKYQNSKSQGSITPQMIIDEINKNLNLNLDKKKLKAKYITKPGEYKLQLDLYQNVICNVKIIVKGID